MNPYKRYLICLVQVLVAFCAFAEEKVPSVLRVNPSAEDVSVVKQVTIEFNQPMVPIGRMERTQEEVSVEITPKLDCQWRWLNTSSLACQLDDKSVAKSATKYTVKVLSGFKNQSGVPLKQEFTQTFITKRPEVLYAWFKNWESPIEPNIFVTFDPPVKESSIEEHLYFVDKNKKRYGVSAEKSESAYSNMWLLTAKSKLPKNTQLKLMVEPGVLPEEGGEASIKSRELLDFATFGDFKFLGLQCYPKRKSGVEISGSESNYEGGEGYEELEPIIVLAGSDKNNKEKCDPTNSFELMFSAPVKSQSIKEKLGVTPDLKGGRTDFDPWEYVTVDYEMVSSHDQESTYPQYMPVPLKALETYRLKAEKGSLIDTFGRPLSEAIDFSFHTDHRPAKFHLNNQVSVLEKEEDTSLPIVVTNLNKVTLDYGVLTQAGYAGKQKKDIELYKAQDIAYYFPLKVREILNGKSGIVSGYIQGVSKKLKAGTWFFSQVTPYSIHAKIGHYNSLVWVTKLSDGTPVSGAKVSLVDSSYYDIERSKQLSRVAVTKEDGTAVLDGTAKISPDLVLVNNWSKDSSRIFVKVEKDGEISILPASWDFDLSYEAMYPYGKKRFGHMKAWGTTAQGVYKLGDTIQYKIYVRNQDVNSLVRPKSGNYILKISDPMGNVVTEKKGIRLNEFGSFEGEVELTKTGPVGWYTFELASDFTDFKWDPLRVLVSDFTPASFRVTTEVDKKVFNISETAGIKSLARLHAGGPFAEGGVRATALISTMPVDFDKPALSSFEFGSGIPYESKELFSKEDKLDSKGDFETSFVLTEEDIHYGKILFETAVTDERGKRIASNVSADYYSRDRFVGLKQEDWLLEASKPSEIKLIVVNQKGETVPGEDIHLEIQREEVIAAKVKSPGNAYLSQYDTEWKIVSECNVKSGVNEVICNYTPDKPGSYKFTASIKDTHGRSQSNLIERYATGPGYVSWRSDSSNTLQVIPEKNSYKLGETAKYLVKNPLPGARALISIERLGIISSYVKEFKESTEVIEVPVKDALYPGFYLSVVVMSGRVDKPIENQVDLGKPTFKIGYAKTEVRDSTRELGVRIESEKDVYKPRETAKLNFTVTGTDLRKGSKEIAVAVLDEAVFDLIASGKDYFDPFKGFYGLDYLDVRNYNLLKQLVGRQKFEKKGANPGGGGGSSADMRSIFKFVSYWNPSLITDANGKASASFTLPDNLTGWRVLAITVDKKDRMGLGQGNFKVNQAIEIRPALPNLAREGDDFTAAFSLMNRTDGVKTVKASLQAEGTAISEAVKTETSLTLEPFKRQNITLPLKAIRDGDVLFTVKAEDGADKDAVEAKISIKKSLALETAATYGSTTEKSSFEEILFPENMRTDAGNISVTLSPSVIGGIEGAYKYMKIYPYSCWEQRITKAVMAAHYQPLKAYLPNSFAWDGASDLVKQTLSDAQGFQAPNGGMTFYVPRNEVVNPYLSAFTSLAFTWFTKLGYEVPKDVEDKLDQYLLEYLKKDNSPDYYSKGMTTSMRAIILAALSRKNKVSLADVTRLEPHLSEMDLFGKAHLLMAASNVQGAEELQKKISDVIMSTANVTGGKYIFSEEIDAVYTRVLSSLPRTQCAVLSALISSKQKLGDKLAISEDTFYKTVRSITQFRTSEGHWESTQENLFCMNALVDYSEAFEKAGANYSFEVSLDKDNFGKGRFLNVQSEPVTFEKTFKQDDPGKKAKLEIEKTGEGRVYYQAALKFSPKELKKDPINSGISVVRELSVERNKKWVLLKSPYKIKQGEMVKVDLFISAPAARNYVVVNDPVPGGLEPLNSDLATTSQADIAKLDEYQPDSFWYTYDNWMHFSLFFTGFYHKEMRHDSARFYSEYLQAGNYHLSYLAQAIAAGKYIMLPLKAEEMYDADVFGQGIPETLEISPNN